MESQKPFSHWSEQSSNAESCCMDCGRSDETVRFVSYPYVFSLLVITYRRSFTGIWCARHRLWHGSLALLITSIFGWFGIPWGLVFTPIALFQLARGGIKNTKENADLLATLGEEKLTRGDRDGAIRCFEQCLLFRDRLTIHENLKSLYAYRFESTVGEGRTVWQFIVVFAISLFLYFFGILAGLIDYGASWLFNNLFSGEWTVTTIVLSWIPLVFLLFVGVILLRKALEWSIPATKISNIVLVNLLVLFYSVVLVYATASGDAVGKLIHNNILGIQLDVSEIFSTIFTLVARGGIYFLNYAIISGGFWGILYLIILPGFVVLSLVVNIPLMVNIERWQGVLREISSNENDEAKGTSTGTWFAIASIAFGFVVLYWLTPQQEYVDVLAASDHFFAGLSYRDANDYEKAVTEFEKAVQLRPTDVNAWLELGFVYYSQGDYEAAVEIFADALNVNPASLYLHDLIGWSYYQLGEVESAEKHFGTALEFDQSYANSHLGLGWIYLNANSRKAIDEFKLVLTQYPEHANAHLGLGAAYYLTQDNEHALDELKIAVQEELIKSEAYLLMGRVYYDERQYELARDAFTKVLEIVPDHYNAYVELANVDGELDDYKQAIRNLKVAIYLQPENPVGYIYLSGIYAWQGDYKQSLNEIEKALKVDPKNKMAHAVKSSILLRMGQNEAAEAELQRADEILAVDYASEYVVATVHGGMQQYADAISHLEEAVQLLPGTPDIDHYTSLAGYYSALGKFDQAHKAIDDAIEIDSTDPALYVTQAIVYIDQENLNAAEESFQKALEIDPKDEDAHAGLSFVYQQTGIYDAALQEAELAIQYSKYSRRGYKNLAFSYHALGRLDEAVSAAKEAIRLDQTSDLPHYILGICYMEQGMNEEAAQEFEKFLSYYYERAYVRDYKLKAEEYLETLNSLP